MKTENQKWFYSAQKDVEERFKDMFKEWNCAFQQVTDDRVTEFYNTTDKDTGAMRQHVVTIFKVDSKEEYRVLLYSVEFISKISRVERMRRDKLLREEAK